MFVCLRKTPPNSVPLLMLMFQSQPADTQMITISVNIFICRICGDVLAEKVLYQESTFPVSVHVFD